MMLLHEYIRMWLWTYGLIQNRIRFDDRRTGCFRHIRIFCADDNFWFFGWHGARFTTSWNIRLDSNGMSRSNSATVNLFPADFSLFIILMNIICMRNPHISIYFRILHLLFECHSVWIQISALRTPTIFGELLCASDISVSIWVLCPNHLWNIKCW